MPVRFLIADDMPAQQRLLANVVLFLGGESRFASNGREALRLAREESFDIVLLDLSMPELGGVATANDLIEGWKSLPLRPRIVAVTGEKDDATRTLCRAVGMDGFLTKPFTAASVRKMLKQLITHGHCWPEGAPRRILNAALAKTYPPNERPDFDREVIEARTLLRELAESLDSLTAEQRTEKAKKLADFARSHGLVSLAPSLDALVQTAARNDSELPADLAAELEAQRGDFEHAITALRAWHHHAPAPLRMSA